MKPGAPGPFGVHLKAQREAAGFTQEELATIAGLSVPAVSALGRGERRRPHLGTVRALSASGNLIAAREHITAAAGIFHTLSIGWASGSALSGLGGVALATGDVAAAEELLDEATSVLRDSGPWFPMPVRCFRAVLAVLSGQADQTIALMRESLVHIRELHDKYAFVYALVPKDIDAHPAR